MDDYRETIWGIRPDDRKWFQFLTVIGGFAGSVILAVLAIEFRSQVSNLGETARNIVLGIGASFVASGFIAWGLLQVKENMSSLAEWIRESTKKRRERWMKVAREQGYAEGYSDAQKGKPPQVPGQDNPNGTSGNSRGS